jgi:hypothetical protein
MTELFFGARLKIERAYHHINEFITALNAFIQSDCYDFSVKLDPDSGCYVLYFTQTKSIPDMFPCIIGDAIHNLR